MHESVNRGQRHSRFGKDMVPARERLIGRDRHAATFIALGNQLEQHRRFRPVPSDVATVIADEQVKAIELGQLGGQATCKPESSRHTNRQINLGIGLPLSNK